MKISTSSFVKILSSGVIVLLVIIFNQNCAIKNNSTPEASNKINTAQVTGIQMTNRSGYTSYEYHFEANYKLDFNLKSITVTESHGASSPGPWAVPGTRALTDLQIAQVQNLLSLLQVATCKGPEILDGGFDSISLYSTSLTVADLSIINGACYPNSGTTERQAIDGFKALSDYLKTL